MIFLYPVITKAPEKIQVLTGKEKGLALSRLARQSAACSAAQSGLFLETFEKTDEGVPRPFGTTFWSISHKPGAVAGVVSTCPVGIDIEQIKRVSKALFERIMDTDEVSCFSHQDPNAVFFRAFTAKEAVLKKTGHGIKGLSGTKIHKVTDDHNLVVQYRNKKYRVENFYFDNYLASVTKDTFEVHWTVQ